MSDPAAEQATPEGLLQFLSSLRQGDLLPLGAVVITGHGLSPTILAARSEGIDESTDWSITIEGDLGWYAIISGGCEIERTLDIEPSILIAPVMAATKHRYSMLRSGMYSPREFPLPKDDAATAMSIEDVDDFWPVVDLRFVTNLDKSALAGGTVPIRQVLQGLQRVKFATWVGRRFDRSEHSTYVEQTVLRPMAKVLKKLAAEFSDKRTPGQASPDVRLVGAAEEWFVRENGRSLEIFVQVSEGSCTMSGLPNPGEDTQGEVKKAADRLAGKLRAALSRDAGYTVTVTPMTLHGVSAATYLTLTAWLDAVWDSWADPLTPADA